MGSATGLHADGHRRQLRQKGYQGMAREPLAPHNLSRGVRSHEVEDFFGQIDADGAHMLLHWTRPHSIQFSGGALRYSQYAWHFNMLPPPCLIHTHHRQRGDETWCRPPKQHAKTEPSPSISRIHPPTSS